MGPHPLGRLHRAIFHTPKSDVFCLNLQIVVDNRIIILPCFVNARVGHNHGWLLLGSHIP